VPLVMDTIPHARQASATTHQRPTTDSRATMTPQPPQTLDATTVAPSNTPSFFSRHQPICAHLFFSNRVDFSNYSRLIESSPTLQQQTMGLLSIFPESFAVVETWITRVFVSCHSRVCSAYRQLIDPPAIPRYRYHRPMGCAACI
jgi:hypothetical protein